MESIGRQFHQSFTTLRPLRRANDSFFNGLDGVCRDLQNPIKPVFKPLVVSPSLKSALSPPMTLIARLQVVANDFTYSLVLLEKIMAFEGLNDQNAMSSSTNFPEPIASTSKFSR